MPGPPQTALLGEFYRRPVTSIPVEVHEYSEVGIWDLLIMVLVFVVGSVEEWSWDWRETSRGSARGGTSGILRWSKSYPSMIRMMIRIVASMVGPTWFSDRTLSRRARITPRTIRHEKTSLRSA